MNNCCLCIFKLFSFKIQLGSFLISLKVITKRKPKLNFFILEAHASLQTHAFQHTLYSFAGNQALRPSNLISSHNVHRLGECHILCINQDNCYGYNFRVRPSSIYTVNCQLSNSSVKINTTRMKNGSWIFYEDILVRITALIKIEEIPCLTRRRYIITRDIQCMQCFQ